LPGTHSPFAAHSLPIRTDLRLDSQEYGQTAPTFDEIRRSESRSLNPLFSAAGDRMPAAIDLDREPVDR